MGQHLIVGGSINKRPNQESGRRWHKPALCLVCHGPSAKFVVQGKNRDRLAKTILRVTQKYPNNPVLYVHEKPCLRELIQDWAKYTMRQTGLAALGRGLEINE